MKIIRITKDESNKTARIERVEVDKDDFPNCVFPSIVEGYTIIGINPVIFERELVLNGVPVVKIILPETVNLYRNQFYGSSYIKEIIIKNKNIVDIPEYCFCLCQNLKKVILPNSIKVLGPNSFLNCTNLEEIKLPKSLEAISYSAFYNCYSLKKIVFPKKVRSIGEKAFIGCGSLKGNIYFEGPCLKHFGVSSKKHPQVFPKHMKKEYNTFYVKQKYMNEFLDHPGMTKYEIRPIETYGLKFEGSSVICNLDENGYNTYKGDIVIPEYYIDPSKNLRERIEIRRIEDFAFSDCKDLKLVKIPKKVSIGDLAFLGSNFKIKRYNIEDN